MSTIAGEITRIQGGVNDVWDYCEDNGVAIPAGTTVDEARTYLDQIPHGGSIPFMEETDLSYMFDYRNSGDDKILDGINRFKNNQITSLYRTFYSFDDNRYITKPSEENAFFDLVKYYLINFPDASKTYMLQNFKINDWRNTDIRNAILDLSGVELKGNCGYMFASIGNNNLDRSKLTIKINKDFTKNAICNNLFERMMKNTKIQFLDRKLVFTKTCSDCFYYFEGEFLDENGNNLDEITFEFNFSALDNINDFFLASTNTTSSSTPIVSRIHLICNNIRSMGSAFQNCFWLKSIDGIDFSLISGSSSGNLFNASGTKYYDNLGEVGIVNGSTLGIGNDVNLNFSRIWHATADTIIDGQTVGYWYEKFANALGNKAATGTQTITINTTLYNSLTQAQKELITDKGYTLASAS